MLGTGHLGAHGVWEGSLYLRGDGDPTFGDGGWNKVYEDGYGPTGAELVADLRARGITRVTGHLYADPFRFDSAEGGPATDDAPDPGDYGGRMSALVYDHGYITGGLGPAATAVHLVALTARLGGLDLYASRTLTRTPTGATVLGTLTSPPMTTMLGLMDVPSDDLFADLFAKQLGYQLFGQGTLSLGALAIRQAISNHYGLSPTIYDGSGLDKADRSTPAQFVELLARMYGSSVGSEVRAALPVSENPARSPESASRRRQRDAVRPRPEAWTTCPIWPATARYAAEIRWLSRSWSTAHPTPRPSRPSPR